MLAVTLIISGSTVQAGPARHVFDLNATAPGGVLEMYRHSNNFGPRFDVAKDGRFLVARGADPENLREIIVVQNWFAELERLEKRSPYRRSEIERRRREVQLAAGDPGVREELLAAAVDAAPENGPARLALADARWAEAGARRVGRRLRDSGAWEILF